MLFLRRLLALFALVATPVAAEVRSAEQAFDAGGGRMVTVEALGRGGAARGVVVFSHGAFSSPAKYHALTRRWADAGYLVLAPLHADSSDWKGAKPAMAEQLGWRLADMKAALAAAPVLAGRLGVRLGAARYHAAGHSFGALVAMLTDDPRLVSVLAFSPPGAVPGLPPVTMSRPLLSVTGTADVVPMMAPRWQDHLSAHRSATGPALAYVGTGADHYFGGIYCRPELPGPRAEAPFAEAVAISLAFLNNPARATRIRVSAGTVETRGL